MRTKIFNLLLIITAALLSSVSAHPHHHSLINSYSCKSCPGNSPSTSKCQIIYPAVNLDGYFGGSQSTIGVWAKFSSPISDTLVNIFLLGRKSSSNQQLSSNFRYQSLYIDRGQTLMGSQRIQYSIDPTPRKEYTANTSYSFQLNTWYFFYSSVWFDNTLGSTSYGFYDPVAHGSPANWRYFKSTTMKYSLTFDSNAVIGFAIFDTTKMSKYPCVSFAGAMVTAQYFEDSKVIYQWLGLHQANVIVLYTFNTSTDNGLILDRSGNILNGALGINNEYAPYFSVLDASSTVNGALFQGNQLIKSRPFWFYNWQETLFTYGTSISVKFAEQNAASCNSSDHADWILWQLKNVTGETVLAIGAHYSSPSVLSPTLIDSFGQKTVMTKTFSAESWIDINMFCGDYTQGSSANSDDTVTCTFYFYDSNEYANVLTAKPFKLSESDALTLILGDQEDSFCGHVRKFLFYTNTTTLKRPSTCPLTLGTLEPICLSTYAGEDPRCGVAMYPKYSSCSKCSSKCRDCSSSSICFACSENYYLKGYNCKSNPSEEENPENGENMDECPSGYYPNDEGNGCSKCHSSCATCEGLSSTDCLTCKYPRRFYRGECFLGCPTSTFYNETLGECIDCHSSCLTCVSMGADGCTSCYENHFLFTNRCLLKCPTGHYAYASPETPSPTCVEQINAEMTVQTTSSPSTFIVEFNATSSAFLNYAMQKLEVTLGDTTLDDTGFKTASRDSKSMYLALNSSEYIPKGTSLSVGIKVATNENIKMYNPFKLVQKKTTISVKEIPSSNGTNTNEPLQTSGIAHGMEQGLLVLQIGAVAASAGASTSLVTLTNFQRIFQMTGMIDSGAPSLLDNHFGEYESAPQNRLLDETIHRPFIEKFEKELEIGLAFVLISFVIFWISQVCRKMKIFQGRLKKVYRIINFCDKMVNWNLLFNYFGYIQFVGMYYSISEFVASARKKSDINSLSMLCSVLFFIVNFVVIVLLSKSAMKAKNNSHKYQKQERASDVNQRILFLSECNNESSLQLLYVPFLFLRTSLISLVLAVFDGLAYAQTVLILVINAIFLLYFALYRPLRCRVISQITLIIELLICASCICNVYFAGMVSSADNLDSRTSVAKIFIGCSITATVLGFIITLIQLARLLRDLSCWIKGKARDQSRSPKPVSQSLKMEGLPEEPSIEDIWAYWRKSIIVVNAKDWMKPENRDKLFEISNWARELLGMKAPKQVNISITTDEVSVLSADSPMLKEAEPILNNINNN